VDSFEVPLVGSQMTIASQPETLDALLVKQAARHSERMAYALLDDNLDVEQSLTFGELAANASSIGRVLLQQACPGDRVLLAFNNGLDAVQVFWGCLIVGLVPVPAPAPDSGHSRVALGRLRGIAADAQISLAVTSGDLIDEARTKAEELNWASVSELLEAGSGDRSVAELSQQQPDSLAYLQYTSGSTSEPRGVEITHAALLAQCLALGQSVSVGRENDRGLIWLPWFHDYGLLHALIMPVYEAFSSYLMPTLSFMRHPLRWLSAVDKHRITHTGAPNFAFAACTQALARNGKWSGQLDSLRIASCGAEPIRRDTIEEFIAAFAPHGLLSRAMVPSYGLAEAVLVVTLSRDGPGYLRVQSRALEQHRAEVVLDAEDVINNPVTELVSCGAPLPGFNVRIVNSELCVPCDDEQVGEIWISGPSIGRGYWGNPTATADNFHAHLPDEPDCSYLRTGDLGFLHKGEIYITGRSKDLLVVHGRNVYPQDLETTAEAAHASVRAAGVIAVGVTRGDGQESVVLLTECRGRPAPEIVTELIGAVRGCVAADHEIDVLDVVPLRSGSLPRTSSGKPQRSMAQKFYLNGELDTRRLVASDALIPKQVPEKILDQVLTIWSEVLMVADPQPDADFFQQGGDSLLATQIISRLNVRLGIELPIRAVFEEPTPAALAQRAAEAESATILPALPTDADATGGRLSYTQERMWFMHQLAPESAAYNIPLALRMHGSLDKAALKEAVNLVVGRHRILQTGFTVAAGRPVAFIEPDIALDIDEIDLRTYGYGAQKVIDATLARLASQPFRLDQLPLMRLSLVHTSDNDAILVWVMHHIIGDQWSCAVLGRELASAYRAITDGVTPELPDLPLQYADFSKWQRDWFSGPRLQQQLSYWCDQLKDVEPLQLNEDFPRARQQTFSGATVCRPLDAARIEQLEKLAASRGASVSMVLIAALKILLLRHTGVTDIAIGVPVANRHHLHTENLIGCFVNTLVFRTDLSGSLDFDETLSRVREVSLQAFTHQDMPFEMLVRELGLPHDTSRSPLFDVIFNMINTPAGDIEFPGLEWSRLDLDRGAAQFDLSVTVDALYHPGIVFEYATELFANDTIEFLADHYLRIIDAVIADSAMPVSDIVLLDDSERHCLQDWGQGSRQAEHDDYISVSDQIAVWAQQSATAPAVICGDTVRNYAELDAAANRLAAEMRRRGIGRGHTVGLCLPRSEALPEVMLGAIRSGAAYVPLDPSYPRERLLFQVRDANIDLLIADEQTAHILNWPNEQTLLLDREAANIASHPDTALPPDVQRDAGPDDPAYIIYTSGSTGMPKGVVVPHRAVINFLDSMRHEPGLNADDRLLAVTTLGFDIAVLELLLPLTTGACVVMARDTEAGDGKALARLLAQHNITVMQATPSRWQMLVVAGWSGKKNLKALVGGEPLAAELAARLLDRCPELWNMYGPTETTVWSSCWQVQRDAIEPVSLGKPIANTTLQVLDVHGHLCPIGVPGELCIGGSGLALGYQNQPALTALQFMTAEKYSAFPDAPMYLTGDRARWRHDGRLEHLGRFDSQIKLRGYRIEPGEIESHLMQLENVVQALVLVHKEEGSEAQLVAYVVCCNAEQTKDVDEWRAGLRQWLPEHMIPQHILCLDSIPTLPNGKINRQALPVPVKSDALNGNAKQPQSITEHALFAIWQSILQRHDFGIHDNFFDIGGHSMLAVTLVQQIAHDLEVDCSLALLFQYPTVAGLGAALHPGPSDRSDSTVVELLAAGLGTPLFFLSGTHLYRDLAANLSVGSRVYGLLSSAEAGLLEHGGQLPDVKELASDYVRTICRLQPQGPYQLAGFSIGGVIAFEVACQLRAKGEQVELLALLDSSAPDFGFSHIFRWLRKRALRLWRHRLGYLNRVWVELCNVMTSKGDKGVIAVYPQYARVIRRYKAGRWEGPLLFIQSEGDPIQEPGYGWQVHAPQLKVERVPGEHMDMLQGNSVQQTAEYLQNQLDNICEHSLTSAELRYSSTVESIVESTVD